jgi:hypothetical protein
VELIARVIKLNGKVVHPDAYQIPVASVTLSQFIEFEAILPVKVLFQLAVSSQVVCNNQEFVFGALSQVLVQLVFHITTKFASVTYLLFKLSAISAVVASVHQVTKPFASYVIFVLVAQVIAEFSSIILCKAFQSFFHTGFQELLAPNALSLVLAVIQAD